MPRGHPPQGSRAVPRGIDGTPSAGARERNKLAALTAGGRSSATTLVVAAALDRMNAPGTVTPSEKRKLLGLADNRQDAAVREVGQANAGIKLLTGGTDSLGSDFSTCRPLATEGFPPGRNFPRLPLRAVVPGAAGGAGNLNQRAHFLAISEFGPRSLIPHEGRACASPAARRPARSWRPSGTPAFAGWSGSSRWRKARSWPSPCRSARTAGPSSSTRPPKAEPGCSNGSCASPARSPASPCAPCAQMHLVHAEQAVAAGEPAQLADAADAPCVRGCYRCLLSSYNLPDHPAIDRRLPEVHRLLVGLARAEVVGPDARSPEPASPPVGAVVAAEPSSVWLAALRPAGLPGPDAGGRRIAGHDDPLVRPARRLAAAPLLPASAREAAEERGWAAAVLPADPAGGLPDRLRRALSEPAA